MKLKEEWRLLKEEARSLLGDGIVLSTGPVAPNRLACPRCGSTNFVPYDSVYSKTNAIFGYALLGPIGLLFGRTHKVELLCKDCGRRWSK